MTDLDDKDERKMQIKMRKIELFVQALKDDEMLIYLIQAAQYQLLKREEKRYKH